MKSYLLPIFVLLSITDAFTIVPCKLQQPKSITRKYVKQSVHFIPPCRATKLDDVILIKEPKKLKSVSNPFSAARRSIDTTIDNKKVASILDDEPEPPQIEGLLWKASIVILCAFWASNFSAAKLVMAEPGVDSSLYVVARFGVAVTALLPGAIYSARKTLDWETAKNAAICGSWVAFGYLGQTLGLLTTTASKSCVICSLNCIFVAALAEWTRVKKSDDGVFDLTRLIPALVAVAGVAIIELKGAGGAPTIGDLFSLAQPIGFGLGYIQLEGLMRERPEAALPVSCIKLLVVSLASLGLFELTSVMNSGALQIPDVTPILSSSTAMGGILYTGLITTALALWFESIAFKRVPATDASIILSTEPLFAAGTAALFLGETFGMSDYVGAALIVGACVTAILQEDEETDEFCDPYVDEDCEPKRSWPFLE